MSNSELIDYIKLSPNFSSRNNSKIRKITIHHTAGVLTVEAIGDIFSDINRQASSNYGIGYDGKIGLYVDEKYRAWTSGSYDNDRQAVTIEVSNCLNGASWPVSDFVIERLIDLCCDICLRNDIKQLDFTGDETGNLTMHRYFQPTACPGDYLAARFPIIAERVNKKLEEVRKMTDKEKEAFEDLKKRVLELENQVGVKWAYNDKNLPEWARPTVSKLINKGYLKGNSKNSYELSYQLLRMMVLCDRAGVFGK